MWTGAEPTKGQFNETYFDIMGSIVETLAKHGIYAFLDVHQDVMSTAFCLYDGFPLWAVQESPTPAHAFPWPLQSENGLDCPPSRSWAQNYLTDACGVAFQSLYTSNSTLQQDFVTFWKKTASYFKTKPILGYELIDEPWAGDIFSDPTLLLPGQAGGRNLLPLYDTLSEAIRNVDDTHIIFYEPVTWGMIFNGDVLGTGFTHVPGGQAWQEGSALSFHYYCWWYSPSDNLTHQTCDEAFAPKVFQQVLRDVRRTGGGVMMTEWGEGCDFSTPSPAVCNAIMALADHHFISYSDWYFGERLNENWTGTMTKDAQLIFARPYAQAIGGRPEEMSFEVESRVFQLCYEVLGNGESEIAVPKLQYEGGVEIELSDNLEVVGEQVQGGQRIVVRNVKRGRGCVKISPK